MGVHRNYVATKKETKHEAGAYTLPQAHPAPAPVPFNTQQNRYRLTQPHEKGTFFLPGAHASESAAGPEVTEQVQAAAHPRGAVAGAFNKTSTGASGAGAAFNKTKIGTASGA